MRLLIVSDMAHYMREDELVGWGPAVEEINHLSGLFTEVRHIGCLHPGSAPGTSLPYTNKNITFIPVPPSGGDRMRDKISILKLVPHYASIIWKECARADMVHLRCPANVPMVALFLLMIRKTPKMRWVKYAGNWAAGRNYPFFYRLQRWILEMNLCRATVTINGSWHGQKKHVLTFQNPCLTEEEILRAVNLSRHKKISRPLRLIFVGALNERKGISRLLEISAWLNQDEVPFLLDILGDGSERSSYEKWAVDHGLTGKITFHGWIPRADLGGFYGKAHLIVLPSESEGWPKVLSEGMAYGVVPIAGAVASIPQGMAEFKTGKVIAPYDDIDGYVLAIKEMIAHPLLWQQYSNNGRQAAYLFTYEKYLRSVKLEILNRGHQEKES